MTFLSISIELFARNTAYQVTIDLHFLCLASLRYLWTIILLQILIFFLNHIINKVRIEYIFWFCMSFHFYLYIMCLIKRRLLLLGLIGEGVVLVHFVLTENCDVRIDIYLTYIDDFQVLTIDWASRQTIYPFFNQPFPPVQPFLSLSSSYLKQSSRSLISKEFDCMSAYCIVDHRSTYKEKIV